MWKLFGSGKPQQNAVHMRGPALLERSERQAAVDGSSCSRPTSRRSPVRAGHRPSLRQLGRKQALCPLLAAAFRARSASGLVVGDPGSSLAMRARACIGSRSRLRPGASVSSKSSITFERYSAMRGVALSRHACRAQRRAGALDEIFEAHGGPVPVANSDEPCRAVPERVEGAHRHRGALTRPERAPRAVDEHVELPLEDLVLLDVLPMGMRRGGTHAAGSTNSIFTYSPPVSTAARRTMYILPSGIRNWPPVEAIRPT
jgi:hypothetical protein